WRGQRSMRWAFVGLVGLTLAFSKFFGVVESFVLIAALHMIVKLWITVESSRRFALDRHSGALEQVLSTDLSVRDIMQGQILALRRHFAFLLGVILAVDVVLFSIAVQKGANQGQLI